MENKLELNDEQLKALTALARKYLEEEREAKEKGEEPPAPPEGMERKAPEKVEAVDPTDAQGKKAPVFPAIHTHKPRELKDFSIAKAIRGVVFNTWKGAELEREWIQKATLEADDDSLGGFLVPEETLAEIMPMLKAQAVFRAAGATVLPNAALVTNIPTQTNTTTAQWIGVGAPSSAVTASNPTFGQVTLTLKACAALCKIDKRLLKHSDQAVEALVRRDIVEQIALAEDQAFWSGTGGTQPTGISLDPDLNSTSIGGTIAWTNLVSALDTLEARNVRTYNAWIMHPTTLGYLRQKQDGNGRPLLTDDLTRAFGKQLLGLPVLTSTQIDNGNILVGDFREFYIAQGGGIQIQILQEKYADELAVGVIAYEEVDGRARQINAFQLLTGITG